MKNYKKSFIKSNLLLIGLVLLIMNAVIMVYSYHASVEELKTVMQQKIEPYNTIRNILREQPRKASDEPPEISSGDDKANDEKPINFKDDFNSKPPARNMPQDGSSRKYSKSVYVFFYNVDEENVSIVSKDELKNNNELLETAQKIYAAKSDFGALRSENLYYYKQSTPNELKISVASRNFIWFSMLELFAVLLLIFILAMMIFYFISKKLADRAARPLEDAIAREKQFITDASHDLKTPLTVILSNADILCRNRACSVSEMSKWIDGTRHAANDMKELIEQMLVLSESETKTEIKKEDVNISDIAEQSTLVMESVAYEKNIDYKTEIQPNIVIKGSADYVKRIVISLIDNAIKYELSGGSVCVSLKDDKKSVCFSVRNKTSVISKEDIPHIFERFYRADKSRHADGSHGLGLAIVKNLTELMGGKIKASSSEKDGTAFTVTLPK